MSCSREISGFYTRRNVCKVSQATKSVFRKQQSLCFASNKFRNNFEKKLNELSSELAAENVSMFVCAEFKANKFMLQIFKVSMLNVHVEKPAFCLNFFVKSQNNFTKKV